MTALAAGAPLSAAGTAFTVDSTTDAVDAAPGDGACATAADECTLRAAVQETNALPGGDAIALPAGTYAITIPGANEDAAATGDLDITDDLTLTGAGRNVTVIDANQLDRVIHSFLFFHTALNVEMAELTIQNGRAELVPGVFESISGGGIFNGSGVSMKLMRVAVRENRAVAGFGGGIYNGSGLPPASISMDQVEISGNVAGSGGGLRNDGVASLQGASVTSNTVATGSGGGIENAWVMTVTQSSIEGNRAGNSAGVSSFGDSTFMLTDSRVSENVAATSAGGIRLGVVRAARILRSSVTDNQAGDEGGAIVLSGGDAVHLLDSLISHNRSGTDGGGLYLASGDSAPVIISNSTFSGNHADGRGGAVFVLAGTIDLNSVTVAENGANAGGGLAFSEVALTRMVRASNTVFAANPPSNCAGPGLSHGYNLEDANSCGFSSVGDLVDTDPVLLSLSDQGGPTQTHALPPGSPAIDAGGPHSCGSTDQRGAQRPTDGDGDGTAVCDIGAYEAPGVTQTTRSPTPSSQVTPAAVPRTGRPTGTSPSLIPAALAGAGIALMLLALETGRNLRRMRRR